MLKTKREKIKGHYRLVTRNEKGQIVTSEKWSPKKPERDIIECDLCDNCEKVLGLPAHNQDSELYEWACVGLITEPLDPTDIHDHLNKIRLCLENNDKEKLTAYEWTPWEASLVATGLGFAVTKYLEDFQPDIATTNHMLKNGFHDRNKGDKQE